MKVDSTLVLKVEELNRQEWRKLFTQLTFFDADDQQIQAYQASDGVVKLPRGVWSMLPSHVSATDLRAKPPMPKVRFAHTLDEKGYGGQADAVAEMFRHEQGQIVIPPGGGKTEIGLAFAAQCETRTLVVVHTKDLFEQWVTRAKVASPEMSIGEIRASKSQVGHLTIAMAQTLKKHLSDGGKFWRQFGAIIIDESHHAAAETWEWLLNTCPAYYRFGLTATKRRADGRQNLVTFYIGPVIKEVAFQSKVPLEVQPVRTGFKGRYRGPFDWSRMLRQLSEDPERNARIAGLIVHEAYEKHCVLVLSRQIKHLEAMASEIDRIEAQVPTALSYAVMTGSMPQKRRNEIMADFRSGKINVLLATQLADEGLDVPMLDRVFLTFPGKHDGRIIQQIGRAIRQYPDKEDAKVYDFVDDFVPPLARQFVARKRTYKQLGIPTKGAIGYGTDTEKKENRGIHHPFSVARSGRS